MTVKTLEHLLSTPLATVPLSSTLAHAAALMRERQISSLLVTEPLSGSPEGIITERDILNALARKVPTDSSVAKVMSTPVISAPANTEFRDGYHQLAFHNIRHLLITGAFERPCGIISESDFRNHLSSSFLDRLNDIRGLMSASALTMPETSLLRNALRTMAEHRFTCVIATRNRKPVGILTEFDAIRLYNDKALCETTPISAVMNCPVRTIPEHTAVPVALQQMQENNIRHLVIVDRQDNVVGIVSEHDIVHQIEIEFAGEMRRQKEITASELRRYENKLHAIFDTTNIFLALLDTNGCLMEVNASALKMGGFDHDDVLHKPIWDTLWLQDRFSQIERLRAVVQDATQGHTTRIDTQHLDAQGRVRYCDCRFQPIYNDDREVEYILIEGLDVTDLRQSQEQLQHMAYYDPLTNLANRTLLSERMDEALALSQATGQQLAICYLDLDHFKPVNDDLGHDVGDQLLIEVSKRLLHTSRSQDTIARLGGDEFVMLLPSIQDRSQAEDVLKRVLAAISAPYQLQHHRISISASLGYTLFPQDDNAPDVLLRHADQAMYRAKQLGRNRYYLFDNDSSLAEDYRLRLIQQASQALNNSSEFELRYQPKVNMRSGEVVGAEALIRWQHPSRGLQQPGDFLPAFKAERMMVELDSWVLETAIKQLAGWYREGLRIGVSVNISAQFLQDESVISRLGELFVRYPDAPPQALELEILETVALDDITIVSETIQQCRELGVNVSLDDFGTGYSSLTHLKQLPADCIKIDRTFVRGILDDPDDLAIVEGILGLANAFRLSTVAEGVENTAQGVMLLYLGCEQAQGYAIAEPMPASEFADWASNFKAPEEWKTVPSEHLSPKNFPLLAASVDHRSWVNRVIAYVRQEVTEIMTSDADDHRACRFGRWLHSDGLQTCGAGQYWDEIDRVHQKIHRHSSTMIRLTNLQQHQDALGMIPELLDLREQLLEHLRQWYAESPNPV